MLHFDSSDDAAKTNLLRLLGGFADKSAGVGATRQGISASALCKAMAKLDLDLPTHTAAEIVRWYASVDAAIATDGTASGNGARDSSGNLLMPLGLLIREVNHVKRDILANSDEIWEAKAARANRADLRNHDGAGHQPLPAVAAAAVVVVVVVVRRRRRKRERRRRGRIPSS